ILDEIVPRFTILQLYQAVLESQASEHSARMVAMRNAPDNAEALSESLTLVYNKARQAGITSEILDIVGGAEALQNSIEKLAVKIERDLAAQPRNHQAVVGQQYSGDSRWQQFREQSPRLFARWSTFSFLKVNSPTSMTLSVCRAKGKTT